MNAAYRTPGVYREELVLRDDRLHLPTGVAGFVGGSAQGAFYAPALLQRRDDFATLFGAASGFLDDAIDGFFANGGQQCYVARTDPSDADALSRALAALAQVEAVDLVCAPDIALAAAPHRVALQRTVLDHCAAGDRFALLDAPPDSTAAQALELRGQLDSRAGALYFPWIITGAGGAVPPCGHIAGVVARTDRAGGVFRAPANQTIVDALDLAPSLDQLALSELSTAGVNCLQALPGRGIRVMGGRTLAGPQQTEWTYINVVRLFLTVGRWLERAMLGLAFEPNELRLWARTRRELTGYLLDLWRQGALLGQSAEEAFYVKCDAETNPPDVREAGMLAVEIGLAVVVPAEFVVVRIVQRDDQVAIV